MSGIERLANAMSVSSGMSPLDTCEDFQCKTGFTCTVPYTGCGEGFICVQMYNGDCQTYNCFMDFTCDALDGEFDCGTFTCPAGYTPC